jgi:hypothetical protein
MYARQQLIAGAASLAISALMAAQAPVGDAWAASRALGSQEVQAQFKQCGYAVGNPGAPVGGRYLVVRDPGYDLDTNNDTRIVMAIVYADVQTALSAHVAAHRQAEARLGDVRPFNDDNGPQLLSGYGGSVWRGNVALVESSSRTLTDLYSYDSQTDDTRLADPAAMALGFVTIRTQLAVDRDVVDCLEQAAPVTAESGTTVASSASTPVEPVYLPGRPW